MAIVLFITSGAMLLIAYLVGVRKMYGLISGVNTAKPQQKAKMNLPAIGRIMGIFFTAIGGVFLISGW